MVHSAERLGESGTGSSPPQRTPQKYATLYRIDANLGLSYILVDQSCIS